MSLPGNYTEFLACLDEKAPPELWPEALQALWWDARGNWEQSHQIAQDIPSRTGSWIHAYLHRKEGDKWNAGYWYDRAGKSFPDISLDEERETLVRSLLKGADL